MVLVAALGIDGDGNKHPLGLIEGVTENTAVVQALIDNLIERGLDPKVCRLFIVDGTKALTKAIRSTFSRHTPIRRCQVHKAPFGGIIARQLRRGRPRPDGRWHLDEVFRLHQRQTVVRLACRGQRRRGPGHPRSTTARPQGGAQADAKTPEEAGRHSSHHRDRQARILQLCAARTWCCAAARHRSLAE